MSEPVIEETNRILARSLIRRLATNSDADLVEEIAECIAKYMQPEREVAKALKDALQYCHDHAHPQQIIQDITKPALNQADAAGIAGKE